VSAIARIVCIQLSAVFPDFCKRLVMPDYGLPLIGSVLAEAGYDVTVFVEHVQPPQWEVIAAADAVCMSSLSAAADKTYALTDRIRAELRIPVIVGGTHATYFDREVLQHADYVVRGEGDETILDLVDALSTGRDPASVDGISFMREGTVVRTPPRPGPQRFDTMPDYRLIAGYTPMTRWDMLRQRRLPLVTVQSSRGCHFHCSYCIVDTMFGAGYRKRDIEAVIRDLRDKRKYGRELIFVDNEFGSLPARTKALLRRMIEEDLDYDILVLARTEIAVQDEMLELMRRAGVTQIYQGYESIEPQTLIGYDKRQTVERMESAIRKLHTYGFRISGSFVLGADTDTERTIESTAQFVIDHHLSIAFFFPLWGHYVEKKNNTSSIIPRHRAIFRSWAYIDGNFVTHFPSNMRPSQLQAGLVRAHQRVLSPLQVARAVGRGRPNDALQKALHRLMWSSIEKGLTDYIPWLQEIEEEFYDENDRLLEERLLERHRSGPPWSFPRATDPDPAAVMSSFIERNAGRCPAPVVAGGAIA
jgi:anaerobic magnesium-protoporphyrin IX monomethyl ester cyclase